MLRTHEFKLYLKPKQAETLVEWLRQCCWVYNQALEQRKKAYSRRGESTTLYEQNKLLTQWRERMPHLQAVPVVFLRDALRRLDRGMKAFFRRLKSGEKPGFPRFKSRFRYGCAEALEKREYLRGNRIHIPKLGDVRCRGKSITTKQCLLRIIRRAGGWYAQVLVEQPDEKLPFSTCSVGIDVGLKSFVAMSDGTMIDNPRWQRSSERQLRHAHRRVSRRKKGSRNRRTAVKRLARVHEKIAARRKDYCHQLTRKLVNENGLIAAEKLNMRSMIRGRYAKSIMDAGWGILLSQLAYKAESAGRTFIQVDPSGTSQECPQCGHLKKKEIWERTHACEACSLVLDRDVASACVILSRAVRVVAASACGGNVSLDGHHDRSAVPMKHEVLSSQDATRKQSTNAVE